ncbi:MAG TPA: hypothetical protein VGN42_28565, partial [Pirellulales bacterium]|nr:hypothetical protein [Pirellulales bacterium]
AATLAPREMLWTAPSEGPSPLLPAAAFALFVAWAVHRAKTLKRQCSTCGQSFTLASAKDARTQCPECRLKSLSVEQRAKQEKQKSKQIRNLWMVLAAIVLAFSIPVAASFNQHFGVQSWLLAYLLAVAAIALGAPAALIGSLFAYVYLRRWWRFRENNLLRMVESSAGPPAETLRFGLVTAWCADRTTFGSEIELRLAACSARIKELTGLSPSPERRLRCFVFDYRESCAKCLHSLGHLPSPDADLVSTYLPAPCRALFLSETELRGQALNPLHAIEGSLCWYLFEPLGLSLRRPWLGLGLANVIINRGRNERLAALNRHMLSALAAGRTLNARALLAPFPRFKINFNPAATADFSEFTKTTAQNAQYWSVMEFICGAGSTPARRLAFQRFLADPRRRKRQVETLTEHLGCSPDQLLADWRGWVQALGVGEHAPPPAEYAELLLSGPIALVKNEQVSLVERSRAIRRLGREGFAIGADALIDVLRQGPSDLAPEAIWALETISGRSLGGDAELWTAWLKDVPEAAKSPKSAV